MLESVSWPRYNPFPRGKTFVFSIQTVYFYLIIFPVCLCVVHSSIIYHNSLSYLSCHCILITCEYFKSKVCVWVKLSVIRIFGQPVVPHETAPIVLLLAGRSDLPYTFPGVRLVLARSYSDCSRSFPNVLILDPVLFKDAFSFLLCVTQLAGCFIHHTF